MVISVLGTAIAAISGVARRRPLTPTLFMGLGVGGMALFYVSIGERIGRVVGSGTAMPGHDVPGGNAPRVRRNGLLDFQLRSFAGAIMPPNRLIKRPS